MQLFTDHDEVYALFVVCYKNRVCIARPPVCFVYTGYGNTFFVKNNFTHTDKMIEVVNSYIVFCGIQAIEEFSPDYKRTNDNGSQHPRC